MKFVADRAIPFLEGVLEPYAEVVYKDGRAITRADLLDADALLTRTRTHCDAALLGGTRVSLIATATIGTDHIDLPWCAANGIVVRNAAGCNAGGVMDYVFSALYAVAARKGISLTGKTFGIIGVGHVGSRVEEMARKLGFAVLLCDPPRAAVEGPDAFLPLEELLERSDIVTMHTPLDPTTAGMADNAFFSRMRTGAVFINASRGEVVDEAALLHAIPKLGAVIIDTWRGEPRINRILMDAVDIATPHIAGYSFQGKQNGSSAVVRAVADHFGIAALRHFFPEDTVPELSPIRLDITGMSQGQIAATFQYNYPVLTDDFLFRLDPDGFEAMRTAYQYRREFSII